LAKLGQKHYLDLSMYEAYSLLMPQLEQISGYPLKLVQGKVAERPSELKPYKREAEIRYPLPSTLGRNTFWEIILAGEGADDKLTRTIVGDFSAMAVRTSRELKQSWDIKKFLLQPQQQNWDKLILSISFRGGQLYNALDFISCMRDALLFRYEDRPVRLGVLMSWNLHSTSERFAQQGITVLDIRDRELGLRTELKKIKALNAIADGTSSLLVANSKGKISRWISLPQQKDPTNETWEMVPRQFRGIQNFQVGRDIVVVATPAGELYLFHRKNVWAWSNKGWRRISGPSIRPMLARYTDQESAKLLTELTTEMAFSRKGGLIIVTPSPDDLTKNGSPGIGKLFRGKRLFSVREVGVWSLLRFAAIDGCILIDGQGAVVNAGVILNVPPQHTSAGEGARTAAASFASTYGIAVKVSQDGPISVFEGGKLIRMI